jgi:PAS domain S-box-containing protein
MLEFVKKILESDFLNRKLARPAGASRQMELLELAHDAILIREPDGAIRFWNRGAEALYGWPREQALGRGAQDLLPTLYPKKAEEMLRDLEQSGSWEGELVRTRRDGATVTVLSRWAWWRTEDQRIEIVEIDRDISERKNGERVEISLSPVETEEGTLLIGSARDTSERKELERVLREKNLALERASAAKDLFLSNMSHELRTPLNAIIGFTGTLLMRLAGPLTSEQERQLQRIQAGGKHLLTLVGDLLDLAKLESGKVEVQLKEASCQDVLREVVSALRPMAAAKELAFEVQFPEQPLMVQTDPRALGQIVFNLGNNAIKYTPRGSVRIEVGANGESAAAIHVVDTGAGIKPEDQRKLFQSFERINSDARTNGAGIGLYLSWKLAGMIGARIELQSEHGSGSRFTLFLPRGRAL